MLSFLDVVASSLLLCTYDITNISISINSFHQYLLFPLITFRSHPYFISKEAYKELIEETGVMNEVTTADWVKETIATWRHTILKGIKDPRGWIFKPKTYVKCFRDAYCLERMHRAFKRGLMEYGMLTATKKKSD
jgi:MPBQ/MSBQ methyltransferase